jgi:hypothetical protein
MLIRARRSIDVDRLCDLVRAVHTADGYPILLQENVRSFIVTDNCLAAWRRRCELCDLIGPDRVESHVTDDLALKLADRYDVYASGRALRKVGVETSRDDRLTDARRPTD